MRKVWTALFAAMGIALALTASRDLWLPEDFRKFWHEAWLTGGEARIDPREEILEEHRRLLAEIENTYREKIEREEELNRIYRLEYEKLRGRSEKP